MPLPDPSYLGLVPLKNSWRLDLRHWSLAVMSNPSAWGLVALPNQSTLVWKICLTLILRVWQQYHAPTLAFNLDTWVWQPYEDDEKIFTCRLVVSRVILYLNCFNKMKRQWSPSTKTYIFPPSRVYGCIFTVYFLKKEKEKKKPWKLKLKLKLKLKFYALKG